MKIKQTKETAQLNSLSSKILFGFILSQHSAGTMLQNFCHNLFVALHLYVCDMEVHNLHGHFLKKQETDCHVSMCFSDDKLIFKRDCVIVFLNAP